MALTADDRAEIKITADDHADTVAICNREGLQHIRFYSALLTLWKNSTHDARRKAIHQSTD